MLLVLNTYTAFCQLKPLQAITWVSDNCGVLHFTNNNHIFWELDQSFKSYGLFMDLNFEYHTVNDSLILVDPYPRASSPDKPKHQVLFKFIMARTGNEILSLVPANDDARKAIPKLVYTFKNIDYVADTTVRFTNIHLDTGGSSLSSSAGLIYSEATVNIDSKGNYNLMTLSNGYKSPANYFKGKLSALQLDSLNYLIQHSEIKKLQNWKEIVIPDHAARSNFIVAYNDDVLKLNAKFLPGITNDLLNYISLLKKKLTLMADEQKPDFKEEGDLNYYR